MTRALQLIERLRSEWELGVTVTHLVTKALALAIARHPRTNVKVRFWGKLEQRDSVDIIVLVAGEGGRDLSAHRIAGADQLPLRELSRQVIQASERIRRDEDPQFRQSRELVQRVPWWMMRSFLSLASLCMNELHLDLSKLGLPVDLFGAGMVTSLGMHGIDEGYAPLTPIGRVMVDVLVPRVRERPWVEDGKLTVRPILKLCATFDHRVVDGVQAAALGSEMQKLLAEPESLL
ncbi:MAG: 2-oxo acid dehydrogenase subunit E2 [Myxococcales bacterium]|nr:2-oxo acid dehydrogenase subunit E2 [Myxococcales bacterium]